MNNPRLSQRYAKSLIDIAKEFNQLDEVHNDVLYLGQVMKSSREFVVMLNSPVIKTDKKFKIIDAVTTGKISKLTVSFLQLLTRKNRAPYLQGIINAFVEQYNKIKGIHTAKLTTATAVSPEIVRSFEEKIKSQYNIQHLELKTAVDKELIGGFVLEMEGKLIDASIIRDLKDVKKQFANNDYLHKLR